MGSKFDGEEIMATIAPIRETCCLKKSANVVAEIVKDTDLLSRIFRLFNNFLQVASQFISSFSTPLTGALSATDSVVGAFQTFDSIGYFCKGEHKSDKWYNVAGNVAMLTSGIGSCVQLLGDVNLLDFEKIGNAISNSPAFGWMAKIGLTLCRVVSAVAAIGYLFFAIDAIQRIRDPEQTLKEMVENEGKKIEHLKEKDKQALLAQISKQAWIDLAWNIAEIVLQIFTIVMAASLVGMIVLGCISAVLGIAAGAYRIWVKYEQKNMIEHIPVKPMED